jgi:competence protein ComEC
VPDKSYIWVVVKDLGWRLKVFMPVAELFQIQIGDVVQCTGILKTPENIRNPGEFDAVWFGLLRRQVGILWQASVSVIQPTWGWSFRRIAHSLKGLILYQHREVVSSPYSDLYSALIFGEQGTSIPYEYKQLFKRTGLLHALVVSGSQVSLLIGVMVYITQWVGLRRYVRLGLLVMTCIFFYFLTGGGVSILRSVMMNIIMLVVMMGFRHRTSSLHIMSMTGMVMIIVDPLCVFDMGAVLSFLATVALIYGKPKIQQLFPLCWPRGVREVLAISVAPWLFTMPVLVYFFHHLSLISLVSNVVLMGVIEWVVMIGFFSTSVGLVFPMVASLGHEAALGCMQLILWVSRLFDQVLGGSFFVPSLSLVHLLWMGMGVSLWCHREWVSRYKSWVWVYMGVGVVLWWSVFQQSGLRVTFLDVGQGDCTIIEADGHVMIIDGGPIYDRSSFKDNAQRILDVLHYKGINHIDVMMISHFVM